jgi:hypothetical protein
METLGWPVGLRLECKGAWSFNGIESIRNKHDSQEFFHSN